MQMPSLPRASSENTLYSKVFDTGHSKDPKVPSSTTPNYSIIVPLYLTTTFFGLFILFASARCMAEGSADFLVHNDDAMNLRKLSWVWGTLCGLLRMNPGCTLMCSTCVISLSFWSKHQEMGGERSKRCRSFDNACEGSDTSGDEETVPFKTRGIARSTSDGDVEMLLQNPSSSLPRVMKRPLSSGNLSSLSSYNPQQPPDDVQPLYTPGLPSNHLSSPEPPRTRSLVLKRLTKWLKRCVKCLASKWYHKLPIIVVVIGVTIGTVSLLLGSLSMRYPSWGWAWNFSTYFYYAVPSGVAVSEAGKGICTSYGGDLCLSNDSWLVLSNGLLSKYNPSDVAAVNAGLKVAQSGGLVFTILARDVAHEIPALIQNVESLAPFFNGRLSVVIFENDSVDGSREVFETWAVTTKNRYKVDLITCEDLGSKDCKLHEAHRYDSMGDEVSAIGKMGDFRNWMNDYILKHYDPDQWSHFLVTDIDLAISLSPLGLLHTLGTEGEFAPVAARGIMMIPGALGTLYAPYDYSAFRPVVNEHNAYLRSWHTWFCELAPAGSRWRNQCDCISPFNLMQVFALDFEYISTAYPVVSAFHGATLYPLRQLKQTQATYDYGDDGQRCEHIGFNLGMTDRSRWGEDPAVSATWSDVMYINPKWTLHLDPTRPGGPTGERFARLLATQGVNSQGLFMFFTVILTHCALATLVGVFISGIVAGWGKFVRTSIFRAFAVYAGVNVADVVPGGLDMINRKNTGDESAMLLAMDMAGDEDSIGSDEEMGGVGRRRMAGGEF